MVAEESRKHRGYGRDNGRDEEQKTEARRRLAATDKSITHGDTLITPSQLRLTFIRAGQGHKFRFESVHFSFAELCTCKIFCIR